MIARGKLNKNCSQRLPKRADCSPTNTRLYTPGGATMFASSFSNTRIARKHLPFDHLQNRSPIYPILPLIPMYIMPAAGKPDQIRKKRTPHGKHVPHNETIADGPQTPVKPNPSKFEHQQLGQPHKEYIEQIYAHIPLRHQHHAQRVNGPPRQACLKQSDQRRNQQPQSPHGDLSGIWR